MQNGTGLEHLAIRITELNNRSISVYGINKDRWTADGFLALPDEKVKLLRCFKFTFSNCHFNAR